ncbi:hypothetical protein NPJ88_000520 [Halomonas elongata]|uniref:hypothetical protein n=1 Tax=Halomonas elongata TaxID=2746 RepID=UPI00255B0BE7|nr:hypothetical protein [Halomonas elongata]MDL4860807.1 hypothetical protein [Halomonas elongata]
MTDDSERIAQLEKKVNRLEGELNRVSEVMRSSDAGTLMALTGIIQSLKRTEGFNNNVLIELGHRYLGMWPFGNLADNEETREQYKTLLNTLVTATDGSEEHRPSRGV